MGLYCVYNIPLQPRLTNGNQPAITILSHLDLFVVGMGWFMVIGDVFKYNDLGKLYV